MLKRIYLTLLKDRIKLNNKNFNFQNKSLQLKQKLLEKINIFDNQIKSFLFWFHGWET